MSVVLSVAMWWGWVHPVRSERSMMSAGMSGCCVWLVCLVWWRMRSNVVLSMVSEGVSPRVWILALRVLKVVVAGTSPFRVAVLYSPEMLLRRRRLVLGVCSVRQMWVYQSASVVWEGKSVRWG